MTYRYFSKLRKNAYIIYSKDRVIILDKKLKKFKVYNLNGIHIKDVQANMKILEFVKGIETNNIIL